MCNVIVCLADMIYEDVQRDSGPLDADNGWSSSEFESYDEQSDSETKLPTRSKVALPWVDACLMCVFTSHKSSVYINHDGTGCFGWFPALKR